MSKKKKELLDAKLREDVSKMKGILNDNEDVNVVVMSNSKEVESNVASTIKRSTKDMEVIDRITKLNAEMEESRKYFSDVKDDLEISPILNYLLVAPLAKNPFTEDFITDSGIIVNKGGLAPTHKNRETGEVEEDDAFVKVGIVQEAGSECKYIQVGDAIMWTVPSEVPIPFYGKGLVLVNENRVLVVINQGLSKRFGKDGK